MSDQNPTPETTPAPQEQSPPSTPKTTPKTDSEATFTQADVDRMVGERAKHAKSAAVKELLESMGVDSPDALKLFVEESRKRQEADMSEVEKAQKERDDERKKREAYEEQIATMLAAQRIDRRDTALKEAAQAAKAKYPRDIISWARDNAADELESVLKEDGTVDEAAVKKLTERFKKERPELFQSGGIGSPSMSGGSVVEPNKEVRERAQAHQRNFIRRNI